MSLKRRWSKMMVDDVSRHRQMVIVAEGENCLVERDSITIQTKRRKRATTTTMETGRD